jgi:glycerol-3-phosphate dehydrogenase
MTALGPSDVGDLAQGRHDVIVVGGGIYGAMVHLEAARRGLRSVLVECADFGGATSFNS